MSKIDLLNPMSTKTSFESLGIEFKLSDQLKNFSYLAKENHENNILLKCFTKKKYPVPPFRPIPIITQSESMTQENESKMTRMEILCKIKYLRTS